MAVAALLLFAAGQLLEQSHVHINIDPMCAACTHADGHAAVLSNATSTDGPTFVSLPTPTMPTVAPDIRPRFQPPSRAPPQDVS